MSVRTGLPDFEPETPVRHTHRMAGAAYAVLTILLRP